MKRILCMALVIVMAVGLLSNAAFAEKPGNWIDYAVDAKDNGGIYEIASAEQLAWVAKVVNDGTNNFAGKTVRLIADIDLDGKNWTPIGKTVSNYCTGSMNCFSGNFEGNNHTISNLNIDVTSENDKMSAAGLFGAVLGNIKGIKVIKANIKGCHFVGTIAGYLATEAGRSITDCIVENTTLSSNSISQENEDMVGGIVGYCVRGDYVNNCTVKNAMLSGYRNLGGIVGCASGEINNCKVLEKLEIEVNQTSNPNGEQDMCTGGVIGWNLGTTYNDNNSAPAASVLYVVNTVEKFKKAVADTKAENNNTIKLTNDINITGTVELLCPMSIIGADDKRPTITITGNSYGFRVGKGKGGEYRFDNLNIVTDSALSCISIQAYDATEPVSVIVSDCNLTNNKKTAIDYEDTTASHSEEYFNLKVKDCAIVAKSYGMGSGLDNGNPDVSGCVIEVENTSFDAPSGDSMTYGIHGPRPFKELCVIGCSFSDCGSGGIKYQYDGDDATSVIIKNNDFSKCTTGDDSYALMATNNVTTLNNDDCYYWATELSGNNFCGQNVLIATRAEVEAVWFPDGYAKNNESLNNRGNKNITDSGTRYMKSGYSFFADKRYGLTDFNVSDENLSLTIGGSDKKTEYFYNTRAASGAYTNHAEIDDYWTTDNPKHCVKPITNWNEANSITRWKLDDVALIQDTKTDNDGKVITLSTLSAENETAKVVVDTVTGNITVSPKKIGDTILTGTVGGGADGTLPNSKSAQIAISVGPKYVPPINNSPAKPEEHAPVEPAGDILAELNREDHFAYIIGYPDGNVRPDTTITRAEVATIFFRMLSDVSRQKIWSQTNNFSDVSSDAWYNNAVSTLTNGKIISGYPDGCFKPNEPITRAEFAAIAAKFYEATVSAKNTFADIENHWAKESINTAHELGLISGYPDGNFYPDKNITRAESMTLMNNVLERAPDKANMLEEMTKWPDNSNEQAWYYEAVQEATNSHDYEKPENGKFEVWTKMKETRNWAEIEKQWADAYSGANK